VASVSVVTSTLKIGGAEKQAVLLANVLSERYQVTLIVLHGAAVDDLLKGQLRNEVEVICLRGGLFVRFSRLISVFSGLRPKAIFSFMTAANLFAAFAGRICGVRRIYPSIRSAYLPYHKLFVERQITRRLATKVVFNSERALQKIFNGIYSKGVVIHNCVLPPSARKAGRPINDPFVVVSVARFTPEKDIPTALRVIGRLREAGANARYRLIGYGPLEKHIRSLVRELRLGDHIDLLIAPDDINGLLAASDVALSTSVVEGLSNSLLEAAAVGLPIVATDVGDTCAIVEHGVNGFLASPGNVDELATNVLRVVENQERYWGLSAASLDVVERKFTQKVFAAKYSDLL